MVTITDGKTTLKVPYGAFKEYFESAGFHAADHARGADHLNPKNTHLSYENENGDEENHEDDGNHPSLIDLSEIPLEEMTGEQLMEYAEQIGADVSGCSTYKAMRKVIREHLKK